MGKIFSLLTITLWTFFFSRDAHAHMANPLGDPFGGLRDFVKYPLPAFFVSGLVSAAFFLYGVKRRKGLPEKGAHNKAMFFFGLLFATFSLVCLGLALDVCQGVYYPSFILLTAVVYGALGTTLRSKGAWVLGVLSLGMWFIAQTDYVSDVHSKLFLGMNCPLRFAVLGAALTGSSFLMKNVSKLREFFRPTYALGLLYLFSALSALSIVGNSAGGSIWEVRDMIAQSAFFPWGLPAVASSLAGIYYGHKKGDALTKWSGTAFLLIYLYTRGKIHFVAGLSGVLLIWGRGPALKFMRRIFSRGEGVESPPAGRPSATPEEKGSGAALAVIGFTISLLAALISWVPLIGLYGLAGFLGALLCLACVWRTRGWARVLAVLGILLGLGAAGGGLFWRYILNQSGGHFF